MKRLLILLLLTAPFTGLLAQDDAAKSSSGAIFKFEHMEFDFGKIKQGDQVGHIFKFTNEGTEPIIITQAHGSCGCTVPDWPKEPIKPGETGEIKVTFNSAGKMGVQDKTVTINSNATVNPIVLHVKGTVESAEINTPQKAQPVEKHEH